MSSSAALSNISPRPSRPFETYVEGVRGLAALLVGLSHAFVARTLDPGYTPASWFRYLEAGHGAVLVFFMLSGYVIGLTNTGPFSGAAARNYLQRRAIRLVPIYFAAWLVAVAINVHAGARSIIGTLFFLQNFDSYFGFSIPPLIRNGPVWSLNYEVVYYLLFLLIWWKRPRLVVNFSVAVAICAAGWWLPRFPAFLSGYACGWIFWSFGWWLSQQPRTTTGNSFSWSMLASVFLLMSVDHFNSGQILLDFFHLGRLGTRARMLDICNLASFPACALWLICATGRRVPRQWVIGSLAFVIPVATIGVLFTQGRLYETSISEAAAIFAIVGCGLSWFRRRDWLAWFAPLGSVSYAFYLFHVPMLSIVRRLPLLPVGTGSAFAIRLVIWLVSTVALAWVLERRMQPWIRQRFKRPQPMPVVPVADYVG